MLTACLQVSNALCAPMTLQNIQVLHTSSRGLNINFEEENNLGRKLNPSFQKFLWIIHDYLRTK